MRNRRPNRESHRLRRRAGAGRRRGAARPRRRRRPGGVAPTQPLQPTAPARARPPRRTRRGCHDRPGAGPLDGRDPVRKGQVRPEVDDRQPPPAGGCREDQPAQLVVGAGRHPDQDRRVVGVCAAGGLEGRGEPAVDRVACEVLARDRQLARFPGCAHRAQGRRHAIGDHALIPAGREHLVEDRLDPGTVESRGRLDELPNLGVRGIGGDARRGWRGVRGNLRRLRRGPRHDRRSRGARRPAVVDQPTHRPKEGERLVVVDAVAARGPSRRDDPVAPLPGAQNGNAQPGSRRGLLDRVHRSSSVATNRVLTSPIQTWQSLDRP
jgi:hypothetical protein